ENKTTQVEYLVIDGASTEGTIDILKRYDKDLDRWQSKPDKGISDAFNQGIEQASGEFIGFLNADDAYRPHAITKVIQAISQNPGVDVFHGNIEYVDDEGNRHVERPDLSRIRDVMSVYHATMFVRKDAYDKIGKYSINYEFAMDSEWVHRAIAQGIVFQEVDDVVTTMRLGGQSHRHLRESLNEFRKSTTHYFGHPLRATYFYILQLVLHSLLKNKAFKRAWLGR
ncbi:MAG: glycosyltransferase, partial [Pseudomonadales bacterium]|nr:glycosyltransferase [Pseudomonadales bacterium]